MNLSLQRKLKENWRHGRAGTILTFLLGFAFLLPLWQGLTHWSYDFPFLFRSGLEQSEAVIIQMDDESIKEGRYQNLLDRFAPVPNGLALPVNGGPWHRSLHAELMKRLKEKGAKVVVFDVLFDQDYQGIEPPTNETRRAELRRIDQDLAAAIREHGNVVIAASETVLYDLDQPVGKEPTLPLSILQKEARWGTIKLSHDSDGVIRRHEFDPTPQVTGYPSLAWEAAQAFGRAPEARTQRRWIRYYGKPKTIPTLSYHQLFETNALLAPPDELFRNKAVFIGKGNIITATGSTDTHDTSYSTWGYAKMTGVEIQATIFLNLVRGEWLDQISVLAELLVLLVTGTVLGYGFVLVRPWVAARLAFLGVLVVGGAACALVWAAGIWFSWMIVAVVQIPAALLWSAIATTKTLYREKAVLEESLATALHAKNSLGERAALNQETGTVLDPPAARPRAARPGEPAAPEIPDHTPLRCIGKGAYGEVWLARDIIGSYHAVKVVYKRSFASEGPFLREFKGVQKFTPISRSHPGLVQILHVGRHEAGGYFYCIMEAGDDEITGPVIHPDTYQPRNLARELTRRGQLPARECIDLGIALADALEFLHGKHLIHRDIKPSNIIFVDGHPKFADIGLVTDLATRDQDVSFLGTEGFIAPEGPGTAAADVYSLGKLLYEASMGRDRKQFPELPTTLTRRPDQTELLELNPIILKACEAEAAQRYQSARELGEELRGLKTRLANPA